VSGLRDPTASIYSVDSRQFGGSVFLELSGKISIIANEKCWIEQPAEAQLKTVAALPGVARAVGLPDLHPGRTPVGVAILTDGIIYPHLIGNDVGCGMGLFETGCRVKKFKKERVFKKLNDIESLRVIPIENPFPEESPIFDLGTVGGGNHFAEFQAVEKVYEKDLFDVLEIEKNRILLLVHSGSRGYGERIMNEFSDFGGIQAESERAKAYMAAHDDALLWASRNRIMVTKKLTDYLGYSLDLRTIIDCGHNFVERYGEGYIHRKGAVSAKSGPVVIPGSRGSLTYIVEPSADTSASMDSLSHGAGQEMDTLALQGAAEG